MYLFIIKIKIKRKVNVY